MVLAAGAAVLALAGIAAFAWHKAPHSGDATRSPPAAAPAASTASPDPPAPSSPTVARPGFDIARVAPDGSAVIAGRSAPGAQVTVHDEDAMLGQVTADSQGSWVLLPTKPLAPGARQLTLTSRDPADPGAREVAGTGNVTLVVPDRRTETASGAAQAAPASTQSMPAQTLAVLDTQAGPRLLQAPPGAARGKLGLDAVDYDEHGNIRFGGAAPPGAPVRVYIDNAPAGDARADPQGRWALTPGQSVPPGQHQLRLDQLSFTGAVVGRVELPFRRVEMAAASLAGGRVVVQPGENLWRIARTSYGSGIRYTVIYRANLDQIRDPKLIYPGQAFAIPSALPSSGGNPATPVEASRSR